MRGNGRVIPAALVAAGACSVLALAAGSAAGPPLAATGAATSAGAGLSAPVIILIKNQPAAAGIPAGSAMRLAQVQAAQVPYLARLARLGATGVHGYRLVNAIAARVPAYAVAGRAARPGGASG